MRTIDGRECQIRNGLPEPSCRFIDEEDLSGQYASIMYRTTLDHVSHFNIFDNTNHANISVE